MSQKILAVDDDPDILEVLSVILEKAGFLVCTAASGQAALERAKIEHPDLVVLDVSMPGMSGLDVCQALRGQEDTESLPVILLSAQSRDGDRVRGLESGADDYVVKPFNTRELVLRVQAVLRRHGLPAIAESPRDGHPFDTESWSLGSDSGGPAFSAGR